MPIHPKAGLGELERAENQVHHFLGSVGRGLRLDHLHRVPLGGKVGAAERIPERLGPEQGWRLAVGAEGRPTQGVHICIPADRQTRQDLLDIRFDVGKFVCLQDPFEHIETVAPVGLEDVRVDSAAVVHPDGATIAEPHRSRLAFPHVGLQGGFVLPVVHAIGLKGRLHGEPRVRLDTARSIPAATGRANGRPGDRL